MSKREAVIAAINRGEQYKNIAADVGCSRAWVSMIGISIGYRRYSSTRKLLKQVTISLAEETLEELKSRGQVSNQIRQAVEEYLERNRTMQAVQQTSRPRLPKREANGPLQSQR